ncbi:LysR family transcriptional regulator [Gallaecimonas pentaromativorans]|uniref:DNA-binding transcriptional LysR family regulator n=1 Tax=Gallaecimonas pentaromativorans TaxID=584787 RepID=A0A3N1PVM8_9GAMM|nr:LysR family transcriptional regulator [Gallaecimonas pentaromativorans]ROQ28606.1 DNA-binding transcriptional LysR family regulator [Gallaecimonas pentaromativorans]
MEFKNLRAFLEVVRQGGFSQAAKKLYATQPTISKAVKQLEDEVGMVLLDRSGPKSRLTSAGEVVYQRALRMLAEREDLQAELDELRGLKRGSLQLGLPPIGSSTLYAPVFARYKKRYPGVDVRLVEQGSDRLQEMLQNGDIELGAILLPAPEPFETQMVCSEPLVAMLPVDHPRADQDSVSLDELKDTPFILFEASFSLNRILMSAARRRGFAPLVTARSSQIDFITELVAAGMGVSFLPRRMAEQRPHPRVARVLLDEPQTQWDMAMIWRRDAFLSPAARAWLAIVKEIHPLS